MIRPEPDDLRAALVRHIEESLGGGSKYAGKAALKQLK